MQYPKWFPRPKSWLQAIALTICVTPMIVIGLAVGFIASPAVVFNQHPILTCLWLTLAIGFPLWVFAHIHQFLWGDPNPKFPKWLPSLKSWLESLFAAILTFFVMLLIILYVHIYLEVTGEVSEYRLDRLLDDHGDKITLTLITLTAYGYHLKSFIGAKFQVKRTP